MIARFLQLLSEALFSERVSLLVVRTKVKRERLNGNGIEFIFGEFLQPVNTMETKNRNIRPTNKL